MVKNDVRPIPRFEWQITDFCNYRCEYCCQKQYDKNKLHYGHADSRIIDAVLNLLSELPGSWMVNVTGGEPTVHPRFFEICQKIVEKGHTINLTTNFFLPHEKLEKLAYICGNKLEVITASLHISQTNTDDFVKKAAWFNSIKNPKTRFLVTSVVVEETFPQLKKIEERLDEEGIPLKFQIMKKYDKTKEFVNYSENIKNHISDNLARGTEKIQNKSFFGRKCYTGNLFFRIEPNGNAYRCYETQPGGYLGNVADGTFKRFPGTMPCLSSKCMCPVPANHNMILFNEKESPLKIMQHLSKSLIRDGDYYKNKLPEKVKQRLDSIKV